MNRAVVIGLLIAAFATAKPAFADAIDGEWCSPQGENLVIDGPQIRIPSGKTIQGQYQRHEFAYQVPEGEADYGQVIYMNLINEELMWL